VASVVGIWNSALIKIGATVIMLGDGSKNANACNEQYPKVRDDLLRGHTWNFARALQKLAQNSTAPTFGFDHAYQLPTDWLRTVTVHDNDAGVGNVRYRMTGRTIHSDASDIYLDYVRQVTDPNDMPSDFREALAWMLAMDLVQSIAQSSTQFKQLDKSAKLAVAKARSTDAIEDYPPDQAPSHWVTVRY